MKEKNKKDIGLVVVSKDVEFWMRVVERSEQSVKQIREQLRLEEFLLSGAKVELEMAQKEDK